MYHELFFLFFFFIKFYFLDTCTYFVTARFFFFTFLIKHNSSNYLLVGAWGRKTFMYRLAKNTEKNLV